MEEPADNIYDVIPKGAPLRETAYSFISEYLDELRKSQKRKKPYKTSSWTRVQRRWSAWWSETDLSEILRMARRIWNWACERHPQLKKLK